MIKIKHKILFSLFLLLISKITFSQGTIIFNDKNQDVFIGNKVLIYEDIQGKYSVKSVLQNKFELKSNQQEVPNFGISRSTHWIKFSIENQTNNEYLLLEYSYPTVDDITFYSIGKSNMIDSVKLGGKYAFSKRTYKYPNYIFNLHIPFGDSKTFLLKVKSNEQIMLPLKIGTSLHVIEQNITNNIFFGIYTGIILVMFLYNLFIFFSVRDKSYFYYVLHTVFVGLTQATYLGYASQYLWPNSPWFSENSILTLTCLVSVVGIKFMQNFIEVKKHTPFLNKVLTGFIISYFVIISIDFFGLKIIAYQIMQATQSLVAIVILITSVIIARKGYRPAKFYLFAWSVLFLGIIIFALKDFGILPYNNFTIFTMPVGSALEVILLSFALADRINIMRTEKEESQQKTVVALKENERIVKNQNIVLEQKVNERTAELSDTLQHLKQTQSQLVESEKMSSLGQLTAGIAHEINNPINFVSSSVSPLRQDIEDMNTIIAKYEELKDSDNVIEKIKEINNLKEELDFDYLKTELTNIINGIEEGAKRTSEIVSGLRNFSRLDEGGIKKANINEGIESTLILIKNKLNDIAINKSLGNIPNIECNPGKINQMIMNLVDNAIYAIHKKNMNNKEGVICITTTTKEYFVILSIKDNGIGMTLDTKNKLFEPFFTTKDVGEGTGLGMSITHTIIKNHNGEINVHSEIDKGTEIIIKLPLKNQ